MSKSRILYNKQSRLTDREERKIGRDMKHQYKSERRSNHVEMMRMRGTLTQLQELATS